ncbi:MAG: DUF192 domain-containing protein [Candidatus Omnitrophica bacterium]|nr:DUF192 domain-containing protein [Candidatus Omnitrophota bacterium]
MKIINTSKNVILADKALIANTFTKRLTGLLNRKSLNKGEALILSSSNSIHSFFMRFAIDVIFLDRAGKVIDVLHSFKPFRLSAIYFTCRTVIELPENTLKPSQTQPGDTLQITAA